MMKLAKILPWFITVIVLCLCVHANDACAQAVGGEPADDDCEKKAREAYDKAIADADAAFGAAMQEAFEIWGRESGAAWELRQSLLDKARQEYQTRVSEAWTAFDTSVEAAAAARDVLEAMAKALLDNHEIGIMEYQALLRKIDEAFRAAVKRAAERLRDDLEQARRLRRVGEDVALQEFLKSWLAALQRYLEKMGEARAARDTAYANAKAELEAALAACEEQHK